LNPRFAHTLFCALLTLVVFACESAREPPAPAPGASAEGGAPPNGVELVSAQDPDRIPGHLRQFPRALSEPNDPQLHSEVADVFSRWRNERWERFVDDLDPGERHEDVGVQQLRVESGEWGVEHLFTIGDELFEREFSTEFGFGRGAKTSPGTRERFASTTRVRRVHQGLVGGPDAGSCVECHRRGGPDGAGERTQNAFLVGDGSRPLLTNQRNPPAVVGLGVVELLAFEMTRDLQTFLNLARERAEEGGEGSFKLKSKGVSFGEVRARADGTVDLEGIEGVDVDLVVKPFGWKGQHATLRSFSEEALLVHHGLQPEQSEGVPPGVASVVYGDGPPTDRDKDGVLVEYTAGMLTALQVYLSLLEIPIERPLSGTRGAHLHAEGRRQFDAMGCADCHRPALSLRRDIYRIPPVHKGGVTLSYSLTEHMESPRLRRDEPHTHGYGVRLFSDLKRHDMGADLAETHASGAIAEASFLTRPLWGLAVTAPYLHDGRAGTVDEAIRLHGGDAATSAQRYEEGTDDDRRGLLAFLHSLTRAPRLSYR